MMRPSDDSLYDHLSPEWREAVLDEQAARERQDPPSMPGAAQRRDFFDAMFWILLAVLATAFFGQLYAFRPNKQTKAIAPAAHSGRGAFSSPTPTTDTEVRQSNAQRARTPGSPTVGGGLGKAGQNPSPTTPGVGEGAGGGAGWQPVEISTYHPRYHGRRTAIGEVYDHNGGSTAATSAKDLQRVPLGSVWRVSYRGRTVDVRINDTGSYRATKGRIWLDLSGRAWRDLTGSEPSRAMATARRVR